MPPRGGSARGGTDPAERPTSWPSERTGARHSRHLGVGLPWDEPGRDEPGRHDEPNGWTGGDQSPTRPLRVYRGGPPSGGPAPRDDRHPDERYDQPAEDYQDDDYAEPPSGGGPGRRRRVGLPLAALALLLGGVIAGGLYLFSSVFRTPDFEGAGTGDVIVEVQTGDSTTQIGNELQDKGVVASVEAFIDAARDEDRIRSVQPGFYQLRLRMSGQAAVARLLEPQARVGQLEIRGGVQLDDTRAPDGSVAPGVLSLIARASCTTIDGAERCLSTDELRAAMVGTDPAALGVPEWALEGVAQADPARRLEGLLVPGRYDVLPSVPAADVLRSLLAESASRLEAAGLVSGSQAIGSTPYQVLTIASLVEKEAITPDMAKVARVIYNRLGVGQRLELDSMVNYPLDLQALRTTPEDRARPGPYNSYVVTGLPPTPISAPGAEAISAALEPEPGPWFFFVRCQTDGTSCFAATFAEHSANVATAQANGAF